MPTYDPNTQVKGEIFETICSSAEIVSLIKNTTNPTVPDKLLMYKNVWPYHRIYQCCKEADTHVCFDVVISDAPSAHTRSGEISFILLTHDSLMRTDMGTRLDRLENEILTAFNGNRLFGIGRLSLKKSRPNDSGEIAEGWHLRRVIFEFKDFNIKMDSEVWT